MTSEITLDRRVILGKGAFAIIFRGHWRNQPVAVKRIQLLDVSSEKGGEDQLLRLDHPNVVKVFHVESDDDFKYFALELCASSMDKLFLPETNKDKYRGTIPSDTNVLIQLARGLSYIHSQKLVHRDVNPQNALISNTEPVTVKWADFGLSKPVNDRGSFSMSKRTGRRLWAAPEIETANAGEDSDEKSRATIRSDVWSAGCVFFWFLAKGKHPFGDVYKEFDTLKNILDDKKINWDCLLTAEPPNEPAYIKVIELMLARNAAERPSMAQVVSLLEASNSDAVNVTNAANQQAETGHGEPMDTSNG